jgi:hypothetical protein
LELRDAVKYLRANSQYDLILVKGWPTKCAFLCFFIAPNPSAAIKHDALSYAIKYLRVYSQYDLILVKGGPISATARRVSRGARSHELLHLALKLLLGGQVFLLPKKK